MRVVSLLPAATEIVAALGCADALVGVSHECDFPPAVARLPRVTRCAIHGNALPSGAADRWVREALVRDGTLYRLDEETLRRLRPEVILTQRLCDVCAVGWETVQAFAATLPGPPRVLDLEPRTLAEVLGDVRRVAAALLVPERGEAVVAALEARLAAVGARVASAPSTRCTLLEWTDPPFCGGHWNPELIATAGGSDPLGRPGAPAAAVSWDAVGEAAPDVLVLACCGYPIERTLADVPALRREPVWRALPAVRAGRVFVADGQSYFSRPGPRLVDATEMLAAILHPSLAPSPLALPPHCQRLTS